MMRRALMATLLLFTALGCQARSTCLPAATVQQRIEQHFQQGKLSSLLSRRHPVTVILDNEYDEQTPRRRLHFSPAQARRWLDTELNSSEIRLIPEQTRCNHRGCHYTAPELTMHHAIYLLGWQYIADRCAELNLVHLMRG